MKQSLFGFSAILLCLTSVSAPAVSIFECVDEAGNSTFRERCPPDTTLAGEKKFYTGGKKSDTDVPDIAITLYTVPDCDACDVVKNVLSDYGANFTEKNIENNVELQTELMEKSGGGATLSVPTIIVGEKVIVGFNKQNLTSTLEEAGLRKPGSGEESKPAEAAETEESAQAARPAKTGTSEF
jgi:glutaredoxin 3